MDYVSAGKKAWQTKLANQAKKAALAKESNEEFFNVSPQEIKYVSAGKTAPIPTLATSNLSKYEYDKHSDQYYTYLKTSNRVEKVSGDKHRAMHKAYSDWAGKESTISDIAQEWGDSVAWVTEYKTIHGWTHGQDIFTKEEVESKPVEALVNEAIQFKRKEWQSEYQRKTDKETKEAAEKWIRYEQSTLKYISGVLANHNPYAVPRLQITEADENYALVLPAMDLHFGKFADKAETGQEYSRNICKDMLHKHTNILLNRVIKIGQPDKIISVVGSDWLHIDNSLGTTTKGTPQDMDGTPGIILKEGLELAVEHIDMLRQVAPVELVLCKGNHDEYSSVALLMFLFAWYKDCPDVTVHLSLKPRNYISYGNTLLGFSHGDDTKPADICRIMPHEAKNIWSLVDHAALFTGHKHFEYSANDLGIHVYQSSSLSAADVWHSKKGYVLSRQALTGYIIYEYDGPGGQLSSANSPVEKFGFENSFYKKK